MTAWCCTACAIARCDAARGFAHRLEVYLLYSTCIATTNTRTVHIGTCYYLAVFTMDTRFSKRI